MMPDTLPQAEDHEHSDRPPERYPSAGVPLARDRPDRGRSGRASPGQVQLEPFVGVDGLLTLGLSCLVMAAGCGVTLAAALVHAGRVAWWTPSTASGAARILVLGYRLGADGTPTSPMLVRLDRALALLETCPGATVFVLGGATGGGPAGKHPTEAEAGLAYLRAHGVPPGRSHGEDRSRHTLENLRHYRASFPADPAHPGPTGGTVLVTSRFHLARAALMARGLSLPVQLCAAEDRPCRALRPVRLLTEAFLVHWYVVGRCFSLWTGNRRMLARIS